MCPALTKREWQKRARKLLTFSPDNEAPLAAEEASSLPPKPFSNSLFMSRELVVTFSSFLSATTDFLGPAGDKLPLEKFKWGFRVP